MGKQRGGTNMISYNRAVFWIVWPVLLILLGLILLGIVKSKVFAVILMLMVIGISFSVILPDD